MNSHTLQILNALETHSSRLDKLAILDAEKDNELLKKVFIATLDPYTTYFIAKIPKYIPNPNGELKLTDAIDGLQRLVKREITGNAGIEHLADLLETMHEDDAIVLERIIKKDLRCGVKVSTVNKTWPKLISVYPCLLAEKNDKEGKNIKNINFPCFSDLKADGMRANVFCEEGKPVVVRGRSGKRVDLLGHLEKEFEIFRNENVMIDGELIVLEEDGSIMSRKKGNGLLNKAIKGTITDDIAKRVKIRVWDIVSVEKFNDFFDDTPYTARKSNLEKLINNLASDKVEMISSRIVNSFEEAQEHFEEMLSAGEEGTILKNIDHVWENKRSKGQVKLKAEKDCDLEVIGWNLGTPGTKLEGKMGSLVCASSDREIEVNISGFDDALRQEIFENIDDWIGKIVAVTYNERIKSKQKGREHLDSLFLPRFQELREDKTVADTQNKIS
jgi:ATP-dependent DNA ligase